nr:hypothetical protein F5Y17DRAFT_468023 [Xylariaceae sp. FL0594]
MPVCDRPSKHEEQNNEAQLPSTPRPQSTPPRQYTTVGSVYNPQPQPLQPPVRRGRAAKPLFPFNSEPTPSQHPPLYTPLQQNSDRAVSPARNSSDMPPFYVSTIGCDLSTHSSIPGGRGVGRAQQGFPEASRVRDINVGVIGQQIADRTSATVADAMDDSDGDADERTVGAISRMNINSLVNLASYPNPMQRTAQKKLATHRAPPEPVNNASEVKTGGFNAQAEPWVPSGKAIVNLPSFVPISGAPAPLTAGPPGVRQSRQAALEQESLHRAQVAGQKVGFAHPSTTARGRKTGMADEEKISPTRLGGVVDYPSAQEKTFSKRNAPAANTQDQLCLSPTFDSDTEEAIDEWIRGRLTKAELQDNPFLFQSRPDFQSERKKRINKLWYGGRNMYRTTFDMAVSQHYHRCVTHTVSAPYEEPLQQDVGSERRPMTTQVATVIPTAEHAAPLLSMAFQAIANRPEISPYSRLPKFQHSLHPKYFKSRS